MDIEALIHSFEAGELPDGGFHHRDNVRVAWWYLCRYPLPEALERFRAALRRFAEARGTPQLYHETITTAYVLLIDERLDRSGRALPWDEFAARHADLLSWKPSILARYYRDETLWSDRARRAFIMPDRVEGRPPAPATSDVDLSLQATDRSTRRRSPFGGVIDLNAVPVETPTSNASQRCTQGGIRAGRLIYMSRSCAMDLL